MDWLLRQTFNHFLDAFCEPLEDDGVQLSFQDGIVVKGLKLKPSKVNEVLASSNADMRIESGTIGYIRMCYTTFPGTVTLQMNGVDIRVQPNTMQTLGRAMYRKIDEYFQTPPSLEMEPECPECALHGPPPPAPCPYHQYYHPQTGYPEIVHKMQTLLPLEHLPQVDLESSEYTRSPSAFRTRIDRRPRRCPPGGGSSPFCGAFTHRSATNLPRRSHYSTTSVPGPHHQHQMPQPQYYPHQRRTMTTHHPHPNYLSHSQPEERLTPASHIHTISGSPPPHWVVPNYPSPEPVVSSSSSVTMSPQVDTANPHYPFRTVQHAPRHTRVMSSPAAPVTPPVQTLQPVPQPRVTRVSYEYHHPPSRKVMSSSPTTNHHRH